MRFVIHRLSDGPVISPPQPTPSAAEIGQDEEGVIWGVDVDSLDALLALTKAEGPISVTANIPYDHPLLVIEDDYR